MCIFEAAPNGTISCILGIPIGGPNQEENNVDRSHQGDIESSAQPTFFFSPEAAPNVSVDFGRFGLLCQALQHLGQRRAASPPSQHRPPLNGTFPRDCIEHCIFR